MDNIVKGFLTFRIQIKLYHWKTSIYSRHKASDGFLEAFDSKIDKFIEVMIGSRDQKPKDNFKMELQTLNDKSIVDYIDNFRAWLKEYLPNQLNEKETDLINIRDEILSDLNQMIYLFRLK